MPAPAAAHEIRSTRLARGLTQRELAERVGISASNLAGYESGARPMSAAMSERILGAANKEYPSDTLERHRDEAVAIIERNRGRNARVFGSCASGSDRLDSDIDLLVEMLPDASLLDLGGMSVELEQLLGVPVDIATTGGLRGRSGQLILQSSVPL